jgi:gluconate 2-dehydrogenase gamma chain
VTEKERLVLIAAMDRILPGGSGPGATAANAIAYADWVTRQQEFQPRSHAWRTGLALLDELAVVMWGKSFLACGADEQDAVIQRAQEVPHPTVRRFFATLVEVTLAGFLCPPSYGGNRGRVGWQYIGFRPHPLTTGAGDLGNA